MHIQIQTMYVCKLLPEPFLPSGWFCERYSPKALAALHIQAPQKAAGRGKKKKMSNG